MKSIYKKLLIILGIIILIVISMFAFMESKEEKKDNKQDTSNIYKFDFFNNATPGKSFKGQINLDNGDVDFTIIYGCSLPNQEECPEDIQVKGTLNKDQLVLVNKIYNKINHKDNEFFLMGISYLLNGSNICDDDSNKTCETIGIEILESIA